MVALSVSISANTSPFFTVSPTFLCHPAITPSVMVSLNLGINTTSSIAETSNVFAGAEAVFVVAAGAAACAAGAGAAPAEFCAINAVISSPCLPKMANKSFTCNLPPRGVPICNKTPS